MLTTTITRKRTHTHTHTHTNARYPKKGADDHTAAYELHVDLGKKAEAAKITRKVVLNVP